MDRRVQTGLTVACGIALVLSFLNLHSSIPIIGVIIGLISAAPTAWDSVKHRQIDVNVLMILAAVGSLALGLPVEALVLLFLFSLSNTLEEYALGKTKSAIESLIKLRPDTATVIENGEDHEVPTQGIQVGQKVRISPFEQVPVDGKIVEGQSSINQSAMTGESQPVSVGFGDQVLAGTQNQDGMLVVEVTALIGGTTLDKIVSLVQDAQEKKASGERISAWFGSRYTLFVIAAFIISFVIRMAIGQEFERAIYASLSLFVALSPCALVISVPAATLSALAWSARNGVLIRGGEYIESLGRADAIALDKTGTLTQGTPRLDKISVGRAERPVDSDLSEDEREVLRLAAGAERFSDHPIAVAIVQAAEGVGVEVPDASDQKVVPGMGVVATIDGKQVRVGQSKFFEGELSEQLGATVAELQASGYTVSILESEGRLSALALADNIRPGAAETVSSLRSLGFAKVMLLTGDTPQTAAAVANQVGISDVHASLLPADKERLIDEALQSGSKVVMVGDGVNDAPSLARASVGIAMGGLGSDVALNAADIVLMHDKVDELPRLVRLCRKANSIIMQNLVFATLVIAVLFIGSMVWDALFPETRNLILPVAVLGHEGSTVLVILNGLRLLSGVK